MLNRIFFESFCFFQVGTIEELPDLLIGSETSELILEHKYVLCVL